MKIRFLIPALLSVNCCMFSQLPCPLQSGINKHPISSEGHIYCFPDYTINNISSQNNQVISLSDGKVSNILVHKDHSQSIIIRSDNNEFFVYSNLDKTLFKVTDNVEKNQVLGFALSDEENKEKYLLNFQLWKGTEPIRVDLNCKKPYRNE
jgi:hypothetical protein